MDSPACKLDEEKDVQGFQPNSFNREEVAGQDSVGLGSKELRPDRSAPSGRRADPIRSKNPSDGSGANLDPDLLQLTLDPDVTPAGILPSQPDDQCNGLLEDCRSSLLSVPFVCPLSLDQMAMPAEQSARGDHEADPAWPRQDPA